MQMKRAFTLMEIMIAVAIVGIMAIYVGPKLMEVFSGGQKSGTEKDMIGIKQALVNYKMDMGHYPAAKHGLQALLENVENSPKWKDAYLDELTAVPQDRWGRDYVYNMPPQLAKQVGKRFKHFELVSFGEQGEGSDPKDWIIVGD